MSNKFSDLQRHKNGTSPQTILSDLAEQIQSGNLRALSVAYVDGDGYNVFSNWSKGDGEDGRVNSNMLISATTFANLAAQGFVFEDEE